MPITVSVTCLHANSRIQCNENSTRSYENLSQSKLFKTAITVKLLKSKVTLNIHARYHETQLDLGNIKSKVNCKSLVVKHVTIRLKCGSGTEHIHGEDAERIWG